MSKRHYVESGRIKVREKLDQIRQDVDQIKDHAEGLYVEAEAAATLLLNIPKKNKFMDHFIPTMQKLEEVKNKLFIIQASFSNRVSDSSSSDSEDSGDDAADQPAKKTTPAVPSGGACGDIIGNAEFPVDTSSPVSGAQLPESNMTTRFSPETLQRDFCSVIENFTQLYGPLSTSSTDSVLPSISTTLPTAKVPPFSGVADLSASPPTTSWNSTSMVTSHPQLECEVTQSQTTPSISVLTSPPAGSSTQGSAAAPSSPQSASSSTVMPEPPLPQSASVSLVTPAPLDQDMSSSSSSLTLSSISAVGTSSVQNTSNREPQTIPGAFRRSRLSHLKNAELMHAALGRKKQPSVNIESQQAVTDRRDSSDRQDSSDQVQSGIANSQSRQPQSRLVASENISSDASTSSTKSPSVNYSRVSNTGDLAAVVAKLPPAAGLLRKPEYGSGPPITTKTLQYTNGSILETTVSAIDSPWLFWLQDFSTSAEFDDLSDEMDMYYNKNSELVPPSSPHVDMVIAAKFSDDKWYRGCVMAVFDYACGRQSKQTYVDVFFVDYGNRDPVCIDRVRPLQIQFARLPTQAIPCAIAAIGPVNETTHWEQSQNDVFAELISGRSNRCTICGLAGKCPVIYMDITIEEEDARGTVVPFNVRKRLIDLGVAVPVSVTVMEEQFWLPRERDRQMQKMGVTVMLHSAVVEAALPHIDFRDAKPLHMAQPVLIRVSSPIKHPIKEPNLQTKSTSSQEIQSNMPPKCSSHEDQTYVPRSLRQRFSQTSRGKEQTSSMKDTNSADVSKQESEEDKKSTPWQDRRVSGNAESMSVSTSSDKEAEMYATQRLESDMPRLSKWQSRQVPEKESSKTSDQEPSQKPRLSKWQAAWNASSNTSEQDSSEKSDMDKPRLSKWQSRQAPWNASSNTPDQEPSEKSDMPMDKPRLSKWQSGQAPGKESSNTSDQEPSEKSDMDKPRLSKWQSRQVPENTSSNTSDQEPSEKSNMDKPRLSKWQSRQAPENTSLNTSDQEPSRKRQDSDCQDWFNDYHDDGSRIIKSSSPSKPAAEAKTKPFKRNLSPKKKKVPTATLR